MCAVQKILIIDPDAASCATIKRGLEEYGINACDTQSIVEAVDLLMHHHYQLVILNISFSEEEGLRLLKVMRNLKDVPILVLSSHNSQKEKELAYHLGADDYIQNPVDPKECLLHARALMRRCGMQTDTFADQRRYLLVDFHDLVIDPITRRVQHKGKDLDLTRREFDLLHLLATHEGQVLTHEQLRHHVWGDDFVGEESNAIPISISRLRKKLSDESHIETVRGVGYRWNKRPRE